MHHTLASALRPHWVDPGQQSERYGPVLEMIEELVGVVPNCNPVLEIWPTGFRTFNVLVPNLLNLPAVLVGHGAPKDLVGIALYASSRAAGCPYCIAHHCSFAIRRGADPHAVVGRRSATEAAVAELAEAMAVLPAEVDAGHVRAARRVLDPDELDWIVLAVALGGFLNMFMDAMGIELEERSITDVQALLRPTGWRPRPAWPSDDDLVDPDQDRLDGPGWHPPDQPPGDTSAQIPVDGVATYLRVLRRTPGAVRLDRVWTRGVSGRIGPALLMLEEEVGYSFPVLASLSSQRAVRALATALRDNLDPHDSRIGLGPKLLAGIVYAVRADSPMLAAECTLLLDLRVEGASPWLAAEVRRFAEADGDATDMPPGLSARDAAVLLLAKAASHSPARVSEITVAAIRPWLEPEEIVEVVVWLALLQALNRLYGYYEVASEGAPGAEAVV